MPHCLLHHKCPFSTHRTCFFSTLQTRIVSSSLPDDQGPLLLLHFVDDGPQSLDPAGPVLHGPLLRCMPDTSRSRVAGQAGPSSAHSSSALLRWQTARPKQVSSKNTIHRTSHLQRTCSPRVPRPTPELGGWSAVHFLPGRQRALAGHLVAVLARCVWRLGCPGFRPLGRREAIFRSLDRLDPLRALHTIRSLAPSLGLGLSLSRCAHVGEQRRRHRDEARLQARWRAWFVVGEWRPPCTASAQPLSPAIPALPRLEAVPWSPCSQHRRDTHRVAHARSRVVRAGKSAVQLGVCL